MKFALLGAGCFCGLALAELGFRFFVPQPVLPRYVRDPGYGVRANMPLVRGRHTYPGDYDVRISTNDEGLRGRRSYSRAKPPGVSRVALIGDSFVFGFGVNDAEVVSAVLENKLAASVGPGQKWEVLNFGVPGFGQAEELVQYRSFVRAFSPDWVVLFYFDNDIGNNEVSDLFTLDADGSVRRTPKEFLPGSRAQQKLYGIPPIRWLFTHSHLWNYLRNWLSGRVQRRLLIQQGMTHYADSTPEGVRLTRALLAQFIREIRAAGSKPVVFVVPPASLTSNFPMTQEEVRALGADWIDGRAILQPADYYSHDHHWRSSGHQAAADAILRCLRL